MTNKETKDVVACVIDDGMIAIPFAERLSRDMKKVYVFSEWENAFPTLSKAIVGDGFSEFERTTDIWQIKNEVDLFVFPDVHKSGLQLELESQGKHVWGSRDGNQQELDRERFLDTLKEVGLEVPPHQVCEGWSKVRDYLKDKEDQYIKVSLYRGSFETCHWRSWRLDEYMLDQWAMEFGPAKELVKFLVFENIDTPLEIGADTYCIDGQWPSTMLHGVEWKDKCYLGAVTKQAELPMQLRRVLSAFGPVLKKENYRSQWSMEVRVKKPKFYFIDATCRMGLPSTGSQMEIWKNFSEIVWQGSQGNLVEPDPTAKYSAEACIELKGGCGEWRSVEKVKELKQWIKPVASCEIDDKLVFPPTDLPLGGDVGWLVALGDTPEGAIKELNKKADKLPDGMSANTESLMYVLQEIHKAAEQGIKFGDGNVPKPEIVAKV